MVAEAAGYTLVLPPGWERIPARQGTDDAIRAILDAKFRELPPDLPRDQLAPYRAEIEGKLRRAAAQARKNGAIDLYLPVQLRNGLPVPASFVVSEGSIPTAGIDEPGQIVSYLVNEGTDGAAVTVDGVAGARSERCAGPDPDQGIEYGSRRVDYAVPVPGGAGRWLLVAFSTLGAGDPDDEVARLLVQLFDAMMSTFRWATV
ncbi:MAG TPA: hypothetical protein VHW06_19525 [Streptosporangiaceae bacterium]|nr:hypothetical protein [Streptosporangiaceae bacterium]